MLASQKKILIIGPSGAGKSTLCNAIFNQMVDEPHLTKPAGVCSRAMGVTSKITNYWCDNLLVITDTIGFDDPRFDPIFIAEELRRMLKNSKVEYHKVILCMKLGRVSKPARVYLRLLKAIFDDPASHMILYISGCEDGTTVDEFIKDNIDAKDEDLKELIDSLNNQSKKNEENGIDMQNIITGTMQLHKDRDIDKEVFLEWRKKTLIKIMTAIEVDIGVTKIKRSEDLWRGIIEWFSWYFNISIFDVVFGATKQLKSGWELIQLAMSKVIPIQYNYGLCPICLENDVDDDCKTQNDEEGETQLQKWVLTSCCHRFHQNCLKPIKSDPCPLCKEKIKDLIDLP